jgi:hypothetical protein
MKKFVIAGIAAAALFACGGAFAQIDDMGVPTVDAPQTFVSPNGTIGATGTNPAVGPVGIPLGATELATPGISPPPATTGCSVAGTPGVPPATALFDGGGMAGAVPTGCAQGPGTTGAVPNSPGSMATPPALSAGRANIPLGSTEIANPGLSPMPPTTTLLPPTPSSPSPLATSPATTGAGSPPPPLEPPCPVVGTFTSSVTTRQSRIGASSSATSSPGC